MQKIVSTLKKENAEYAKNSAPMGLSILRIKKRN
jgi:hypothetical protein